MYRSSGFMTSKVEIDDTHPLCVVFSTFLFPHQAGHAIMLMHVDLFFLPSEPLLPPSPNIVSIKIE